MNSHGETPTVVIVQPVGKTVKYYCEACQRWHVHGHPDEGRNPGSRLSHCSDPASPTWQKPIVLVLAEEE